MRAVVKSLLLFTINIDHITDDDAVRQARIAKGYKALQGIDKSIQSVIMRDIVDDGPGVKWSDVVGLEAAKAALMELVVYPALRWEDNVTIPAFSCVNYTP